MEYYMNITPSMRRICEVLFNERPGMDHCVMNKGRNTVLEVPKKEVEEVVSLLKEHFPDVVDIRKAYAMIDDLHDFVLVKPMITEAPCFIDDSVSVPCLEKQLVDIISDKEYSGNTSKEIRRQYQQSFEVFNVNRSRLLRYAGRKGKKEEVQKLITGIDLSRINTIQAICGVLKESPVIRAWVFGSFSRMEERPDSDIDILIDLDKEAAIGLLEFSGLILKLENAVGRKIDLVESRSLKSFARESVEKEKILVYERE